MRTSAALDDAPSVPLSDSAYSRAHLGRAMARQSLLLVLTLAVVIVPNVVSFVASLLE